MSLIYSSSYESSAIVSSFFLISFRMRWDATSYLEVFLASDFSFYFSSSTILSSFMDSSSETKNLAWL